MKDAIDAGLASRDQIKRIWYLAVPVALQTRGRPAESAPRRPKLRERWSHGDEVALRALAARGEDVIVAQGQLGRNIDIKKRESGLAGAYREEVLDAIMRAFSKCVVLRPDLVGFGTGQHLGEFGVDEPHPFPDLVQSPTPARD